MTPLPPEPREHIRSLDGLRGLAVLLVFVYHYGGGTHSTFAPLRWFGLLNKGGWCGVVLFFVLSGFLITGILWDSFSTPHWARTFYLRRSLRIFPLYFGTLLLVLLAAAFAGTLRAALGDIWIPALFLQNMPPLVERADTIASPLALFHFWSLAVEEQFYLLWPLLLVIQPGRRAARLLCVAIFLGSCLFRILIWRYSTHANDFSYFLPTHAGELAVGGWLALWPRDVAWRNALRFAWPTAAAGLIVFLASGLAARGFETTRPLMMTLGLPAITIFFASVLALALQPGPVARLFEAAWLRWLGGISFGLYVYHALLGELFRWLAGPGTSMGVLIRQFLWAAVLSVATAWLSFRFFEKPFLRLKPARARMPSSE